MLGKHLNVGMTPFGLGECRILCEGQYLLAAVKATDLEGASLKEKISKIMSSEGLKKFVKHEQGFRYCHDEAWSFVSIPPGYVVLTYASCDGKQKPVANGIRWSYCKTDSRAQLGIVTDAIKMLVEAYPDLESAGYVAFQNAVRDYMVPACSQ